jgi:cell division protein FtsB
MAMSPRRQVVLAVLALALLGLQARLWLGEGSLRHVSGLKQTVAKKQAENRLLFERNRLMAADVADLKSGLDAVEEIARRDLGMIRAGETFFLMIEDTGEADGAAR